MTSDERLAKRASRGDRRAFAAIYERYHQQLYRFCLSILGNNEDARDALQNTMLKALDALTGEKRQIQLKAWLYRIARNESIDMLRRRRPEPEVDGETILGGDDTAEVAVHRARLRQLLADLAELPERQRSALTMRELGGLEFKQIGEAFGTSDAVARQTVYEARLSLRQLDTGREMSCESVTRELSEADGRVTRRREIQAHLRDCAECRRFGESISCRKQDLAAISPLPAVASAALLQAVLGSGQAAVSGGIATAVGASAGKAATTSVVVKSAATVAVVATIGVAAGDRSGVIDIGNDRGSHDGVPNRKAMPATAPAEAPPGAMSAPTGGSDEARRVPAPDRQPGVAANQAPGKLTSPDSPTATNASTPGPAQDPPGTPAELPPAASHGQQTAAANGGGRANAPGQARGDKRGHSGHAKQVSKGTGGPGKPKKQKPGSGKADSPAGSASPTQPPKAKQPQGKGLGPDKATGPPLEQSEPPDSPGASAKAGAPPSKEAR